MKLLVLTTFVATICYVNAGKKLLMLAGVNGGMGIAANPVVTLGGLNPPMVAVGGVAGFAAQPQFPQFVPGLPAFAAPAPVPNMFPVPAGNAFPYTGVLQMPPMNPPQQPLVGLTGGVQQQQPPIQPDLLKRFRRQIMKPESTMRTNMDTQIPAPAETT